MFLILTVLIACTNAWSYYRNNDYWDSVPPRFSDAYVYTQTAHDDIVKHLNRVRIKPEEYRYVSLLHTLFSLGSLISNKRTLRTSLIDNFSQEYGQILDLIDKHYLSNKDITTKFLGSDENEEIGNDLTRVVNPDEKDYSIIRELVANYLISNGDEELKSHENLRRNIADFFPNVYGRTARANNENLTRDDVDKLNISLRRSELDDLLRKENLEPEFYLPLRTGTHNDILYQTVHDQAEHLYKRDLSHNDIEDIESQALREGNFKDFLRTKVDKVEPPQAESPSDVFASVYNQAIPLYKTDIESNSIEEIEKQMKPFLDKAKWESHTAFKLVETLCKPSPSTDKHCNEKVHAEIASSTNLVVRDMYAKGAYLLIELGKLSDYYIDVRSLLAKAAKENRGEEFLRNNQHLLEPLIMQLAKVIVILN